MRYWKALPEDTIVIEVEPGDRSFGLGFSDEVEAVMDEVLAMVREELGLEAIPTGSVAWPNGVPVSRWAPAGG